MAEQASLDEASWSLTQQGAMEQYHLLLRAALERDLNTFVELALAATPICEAAGAEPGGTAFGEWCGLCPLRQQYGGCRPIITQMVRAAEQGNWEAAQLLVLSLIAEVAGVSPPTARAER